MLSSYQIDEISVDASRRYKLVGGSLPTRPISVPKKRNLLMSSPMLEGLRSNSLAVPSRRGTSM